MEGDCPCRVVKCSSLLRRSSCWPWITTWRSPRIAGRAPAKQARPAQAAPGQAQQAQAFPPEAMDELLGQWELQSRKLETLEVDIYRIDRDAEWGDEVHFTGHAAFKNPDLAYVDYRKVKMSAQADPKAKERTSA
jgi:hypothetical protein